MANDNTEKLEKCLTKETLRRLAGERSFARGEAYFKRDAVESLHVVGATIEAGVRGGELYRTRLSASEDGDDGFDGDVVTEDNDELEDFSDFDDDEDQNQGGLSYSCSCPYGRDGYFCKHLVAAGLAFLAGDIDDPNTAPPDLRSYLSGLSTERLVELLLGQCEVDGRLRRRLEAEAAREAAKEADVDLGQWKRALRQAVGSGDYVSYREMDHYTGGIEEVISSIDDLLKDGHARAVIELAEDGLEQVEDALGHVDDSDGWMGGLLDQLQDLHLKACEMAKPDPRLLAEKLFDWETTTGYDTFYGAVDTYAGVLGAEGLAVYREMAKAEWDKLPALGPGDKDADRYGLRFRITNIMERLARASGTLDDLVAIKARDLSHPYAYLKIAEIYKEAGQPEQAIDWAERGWNAFPPPYRDGRLRDFILTAYHAQGRETEAMDLMWAVFVERPDFEMYKLLKKNANKAGQWPDWRGRALAEIRRVIAADHAKPRGKPQYRWQQQAAQNHSDLVRIFLFEKDVEAAWREAKAGGCSEGLWLELADARERTHPKDAIEIYKAYIDKLLQVADQRNYEEAVGMLAKIETMTIREGQADDFQIVIGNIRLTEKRKRNLMKLLDRKGW